MDSLNAKENRSTLNRPLDPNIRRPKHVNQKATKDSSSSTIDTENLTLTQSGDKVQEHAEEMKENVRRAHEMDSTALEPGHQHSEATIDPRDLTQSEDKVQNHAEEMKENARQAHEIDNKQLTQSEDEVQNHAEEMMQNVRRAHEMDDAKHSGAQRGSK